MIYLGDVNNIHMKWKITAILDVASVTRIDLRAKVTTTHNKIYQWLMNPIQTKGIKSTLRIDSSDRRLIRLKFTFLFIFSLLIIIS